MWHRTGTCEGLGFGCVAGLRCEEAAQGQQRVLLNLQLRPHPGHTTCCPRSELNPRREFERRLISEQLREKKKSSKRVLQFSADEPASAKKKKARRVGPVRVQVLDAVRTGQLPGAMV